MQFPQNIFALLERQELAAVKLAKHLGVAEASVNGWKNGSYPSSKYLLGISEFLGVPVLSLLMGDDEPPAAPPATADENARLLLSLLDGFDDGLDKIDFISRARKLARDIRDGK